MAQLQVLRDPSVVAPVGSTFTEQFYNRAFPLPGTELTTRQVDTVAVDPFTGQPINAWQGGNMPAVQRALTQQQMQAIRDPMQQQYRLPATDWSTATRASPQSGLSMQDVLAFGAPGMNQGAGPLVAQQPAVAAIDGAVSTLPAPGSATQGGLSFADKFSNGVNSAAVRAANPPVMPNVPTSIAAPAQANPQVAAVMAARGGASGTTPAGYVYENGQRVGVAPWAQNLTPAQQYAMAAAAARKPMPGSQITGSGGGGFNGSGGGGSLV